MSDEHIIKHNPFAPADGGNNNNPPAEQQQPLAVRIGFGQPDTQPKPADQPKPVAIKPDAPVKPADNGPKPGDHAAEPAAPKSKVDTQPIYDIQKIYGSVQEIQRTLMATCFEKQPDGSLKPRDDKAKV